MGPNGRQFSAVVSLPVLHFTLIQRNMKTDEDWSVSLHTAALLPRLKEEALQADSRIIPAPVKLWSVCFPLGRDRSDRWLRGWSGEDKEHMRNPAKARERPGGLVSPLSTGTHTKSVEEEAWKAHFWLYEIVSMRWPLLPSCFPFKS